MLFNSVWEITVFWWKTADVLQVEKEENVEEM